MKRPTWHFGAVLVVLFMLWSCDRAGQAERMITRGEAAKHAGDLVKATNLYHRAEQLRPDDFLVHYQLGLIFLQLQDIRKAEEHLEKAVPLRPDFGQAYLNLGVVLVEKGERTAARGAFLSALRFDPRSHRPGVYVFSQCYPRF